MKYEVTTNNVFKCNFYQKQLILPICCFTYVLYIILLNSKFDYINYINSNYIINYSLRIVFYLPTNYNF